MQAACGGAPEPSLGVVQPVLDPQHQTLADKQQQWAVPQPIPASAILKSEKGAIGWDLGKHVHSL